MCGEKNTVYLKGRSGRWVRWPFTDGYASERLCGSCECELARLCGCGGTGKFFGKERWTVYVRVRVSLRNSEGALWKERSVAGRSEASGAKDMARGRVRCSILSIRGTEGRG